MNSLSHTHGQTTKIQKNMLLYMIICSFRILPCFLDIFPGNRLVWPSRTNSLFLFLFRYFPKIASRKTNYVPYALYLASAELCKWSNPVAAVLQKLIICNVLSLRKVAIVVVILKIICPNTIKLLFGRVLWYKYKNTNYLKNLQVYQNKFWKVEYNYI